MLALAAGIAEWALWRVDGHHPLPTRALVECLWAVSVHPSFLAPYRVGALPPGSDPGWKDRGRSAFWQVEGAHRRLVEGMLAYPCLQDLNDWARQVLSPAAREAYDAWLPAAVDHLASAHPVDPTTFGVLSQARPAPGLPARVEWGRPVPRSEVFGGRPTPAEARAEVEALLATLDRPDHPYVCPPDRRAEHRPWRAHLDGLPAWTGELPG